MSKYAIAMSGGVDSSVAAALMVEKYGAENVFGVTMKLFCYGKDESTEKSCCSLDAITDAVSVCMQLGIRHYVVNLEKEFQSGVIDNFISEYEHGRTPNPCIRCNSEIKFHTLLAKVLELGADTLVTGHYARVNYDKDGYHMLTGLDKSKDQSYFLYNLDQKQLGRILFPLGEMTKADTRKLAAKYALKTAEKTESQDICFVPTSTQDFLEGKIKANPGNIVDVAGEVLGKHTGLSFYTIGQRKGLGGGFSEPMYVTGLKPETNELVFGGEEELYAKEMLVRDITWTNKSPVFPVKLDVKIRYNSRAATAVIYSSSEGEKPSVSGSRLHSNNKIQNIIFTKPQKAITPGQTAVFYDGDEVVGGGIIEVSEVPVPT